MPFSVNTSVLYDGFLGHPSKNSHTLQESVASHQKPEKKTNMLHTWTAQQSKKHSIINAVCTPDSDQHSCQKSDTMINHVAHTLIEEQILPVHLSLDGMLSSVHPGAQNGSLLKAGKMFSMSALHATPVAPAAAGELVAAAAPAAEEKASILRKALKVGYHVTFTCKSPRHCK